MFSEREKAVLARRRKAKNTEGVTGVLENPSADMDIKSSAKADGADQEKPSTVFKVSVRNLVSFSIPEDTTWSFTTYSQLQEGSHAHTEIQNRHKTEGTYQSEVYLTYLYQSHKYMVEISGRADGIWELEDGTIIHEIKTTSTQLSEIHEDFSEAHWAQGKCYAFIHASNKNLNSITVRLTYFHRPSGKEKSFDRTFTIDRLEKFISGLIHPFAAWALSQAKWREMRNLSIKALEFPSQPIEKDRGFWPTTPSGVYRMVNGFLPRHLREQARPWGFCILPSRLSLRALLNESFTLPQKTPPEPLLKMLTDF